MSAGSTFDTPSATLVWIDAREARIVRWQDGAAHLERVESDVPAHRRATGHIRHQGAGGHASGGESQTAAESRRLEHLNQFVAGIAERIPLHEDVIILGPGSVPERLERHVRESDEHHRRARGITCEPADRLTDRQLIARLRHAMGIDPVRRAAGDRTRGSSAQRLSRRSAEKPRRDLDPEQLLELSPDAPDEVL